VSVCGERLVRGIHVSAPEEDGPKVQLPSGIVHPYPHKTHRKTRGVATIVAAATLALADDPERLAMCRAQLPASKVGASPAAPDSPGV